MEDNVTTEHELDNRLNTPTHDDSSQAELRAFDDAHANDAITEGDIVAMYHDHIMSQFAEVVKPLTAKAAELWPGKSFRISAVTDFDGGMRGTDFVATLYLDDSVPVNDRFPSAVRPTPTAAFNALVVEVSRRQEAINAKR